MKLLAYFPALIPAEPSIADKESSLVIVFGQHVYQDQDQGADRPPTMGGPEQIEWEAWFEIFDARRLALVVADDRPGVDVDFTRDLDVTAPEIDQLLFPGGYFKEFIFFHEVSRTLILTDTFINIELDLAEPWRTTVKLAECIIPTAKYSSACACRYSSSDVRRTRGSEIQSWRPRRIVLNHGRCFDTDADNVVGRVFGASSRPPASLGHVTTVHSQRDSLADFQPLGLIDASLLFIQRTSTASPDPDQPSRPRRAFPSLH
ncbi:hypothetical protein NKJ06_02415 [Mesorhizobium sp. M0293]|uniref:hypothetical protein n=1 Tax=Mesorhizobium sp. M0293 TaxID=2956930 RepID=UPI00333975A9